MADVKPFFKRLGIFPGPAIRQIANWLGKMELDAEEGMEFALQMEGETTDKLIIMAFMDDIDSPDLEFVGPANVIAHIRDEKAFMKGR